MSHLYLGYLHQEQPDLPLGSARVEWRPPYGVSEPYNIWRVFPDEDNTRPLLISYSRRVPNHSDFLAYYGDTNTASLNLSARSVLEQTFGVRLSSVANSLPDVLEDILVNQADITGQSKWLPLYGDLRRGFGMFVGPGQYLQFKGGQQKQLIVDTYRREYRKARAIVQDQAQLDRLRRWTNIERERLRVTATDILPPEYVNDGELPHGTTFSDAFARANSDTMGNGWVEDQGDFDISSNQAIQTLSSEAWSFCRQASHGLSGNDYYSEAQFVGTGGGAYNMAVLVREASTPTAYGGSIGSGGATPRISPYTTSGKGTDYTTGGTKTVGWYYQLEIQGTNLVLYGGASANPTTVQCSTSQSTYSTGDMGMAANGNFSVQTFDSFEAADFAAGGPTDGEIMTARQMGSLQPVQIPNSVLSY